MAALLPLATATPLSGHSENSPLSPLGPNATGADVRQNILDTMGQTRTALLQKKAAGALTKEEEELLAELPNAMSSIEAADGSDFEALARLCSDKAIEVVPSEEARAAGMKPFTITAKDLEKAQEDAAHMSAAAEAFSRSPAAQALTAAIKADAAEPAASGQSSAASWRQASGVDGNAGGSGVSVHGGSGSAWGGGSGDREVTAIAATEAQFPSADEAADEAALVPTNSLDAVDFSILRWDFGGFKPPTNCVRTSVELTGLKMKRDGLSFKYVEDLSSWGLAYDAADALACLFVCDNDGHWVGGKFDWISSSRKTRDFKNIYSGYEGWSLRNVPNPCPAAFVIVTKDGRKRSNIISAMWER